MVRIQNTGHQFNPHPDPEIARKGWLRCLFCRREVHGEVRVSTLDDCDVRFVVSRLIDGRPWFFDGASWTDTLTLAVRFPIREARLVAEQFASAPRVLDARDL